MMEHWKNNLNMKMIDVSYEDMVSNTEDVTRKTLNFLGLEWDEKCLAPHKNPRPVKTSSFWQVRQPIYNNSIKRWRNYEAHLGPLKETLAQAGL